MFCSTFKYLLFFQRIVVSVNEKISCAKLTVYSIACNDIYTRVLQNMLTSFWRVYILVCNQPRPPFAFGDRIMGHTVMPMNRQGK